MKKIVKDIMLFCCGVLCAIGYHNLKGRTGIAIDKKNKFKEYYYMLNHWMELKQNGKSLKEYFHINKYQTVAIYGMGEMGKRLYEELKESDIEVKYLVDRDADMLLNYTIPIFSIESNLAHVDAMIVTATFAFDEINEELKNKVDFPVVSLDEVVYSC